jgi:cytochrome c oxidase subunit IV
MELQQHTASVDSHGEGMDTKRIWVVFGILLAITAVEFLVALGFVHHWHLVTKGPALYAFYIALTLVKAFYIVGYFMHLKFEKKSFIITCSIVFIFVLYMITLILIEGNYLNTHFHGYTLYPSK